VHDQLRAAAHDRGEVLRPRRHHHQSGSRAQAGLSGQPHCAGHPRTAADDQHPPEIALVRRTLPRRQRPQHIGLAQSLEHRPEAPLVRRADAQIVEQQPARVFRARIQKQAGLQRHKAEGAIGAHRRPHHRAAVAVQPGGHIQREHRLPAGVDVTDDLRESGPHDRIEPGTEQCIDHHLGAGEPRRRIWQHLPAAALELPAGPRRIALELVPRHDCEHRDLESRRPREARQHVAIPAIVAAAGHDDQ